MMIIILTGILLIWAWFYGRLHAYDRAIAEASRLYGVEARLIRSVIWKESRFKSRCLGGQGEIGLMQVTRIAADEWATAQGRPSLTAQELFQPHNNIQAGTWYLSRALQRWSAKPNPLPYALAEYNAGYSNALRWAAMDQGDANKFWNDITYPGTRRYIKDVLSAYQGRR